ncbi:thermonuclease family protein [Sphingomonas sp. CJ99]
MRRRSRYDPRFPDIGQHRAARRRRATLWARLGVLALMLLILMALRFPLGWYAENWREVASGERVYFELCKDGGGTNCVVDGDTIWMGGIKIRLADIDAPETHPPRCAREAALGERATLRLQELLNAGPVTVQAGNRDADRNGRKLRRLVIGGRSVGDVLIREGLARPNNGEARRGWC